jgi:IS30 family transposase
MATVIIYFLLLFLNQTHSRPRKCLKFKTPYEVFKELTGVDVKKLMDMHL